MRGVKMHGPFEEKATLKRMRAHLVNAKNALAENALEEADEAFEEARETANSLGPQGTSEWYEGGIKPIRATLPNIKQARQGLTKLIESVDLRIKDLDKIGGPRD